MRKIFFLLLILSIVYKTNYADTLEFNVHFIEAKINIDTLSIINSEGPDYCNINEFNTILSDFDVHSFKKDYVGFSHPNLQNLYLIKLPKTKSLDSFLIVLEDLSFVSNIYVDSIIPLLTECTTPLSVTDPFNHCEIIYGVDPKYPLNMTGAECAWEITEGNANILIGVVDTEFDTSHPELFGKIESVYSTSYPSLHSYHGTGVAGLIVGNHNNSFGGAGIGKNLRVRGFKVDAYTSVREMVLEAYRQGLRVINVSWAGISSSPSFIYSVQEMTQNGTNLVVGAGNTPDANGHAPYSHIPGVIVVSSHDKDGKIGTTGHSYQTYVDLVAPGSYIYLPTANPLWTCKMRYGTGTSASAPLVCGTIGLMLSVNPCLSAYDIEYILKETALPVSNPEFKPDGYGGGRLNTFGAVELASTYSNTTSIYTNTTWSSDMYIYDDVIIKSGNTLTIQGNVYFGCWSKIIVEKNAKLIIDGGHLTALNTIKKWNGIYLYGNPDKPTSDLSEHGYVEVKNNSLIENASYAINNFWDTDYMGGGIIKVSNSTFKNCIRAINLSYYPKSYWLYTFGIESNCSILNSEFIYDDPDANKHPKSVIEDNERAIYPILSWDVHSGIVIKDCKFKMNIPIEGSFTNLKRSNAIYLSQSSAYIEGNEIENFLKGTYVENYSDLIREVKILDNIYKDNFWGIEILKNNHNIILNNEITFDADWKISGYASGGGLYETKHGVYLNGAGASKIIGNYIDIPYMGTHYTEENSGIASLFTNSLLSTYIGDNTFKDNYVAIHPHADNKKLVAYCNTFDRYYHSAIQFAPYYITQQIGDHGNGCDPEFEYRADNKFINKRTGSYQLYLYKVYMGVDNTLETPWVYYSRNVDDERITSVYDPEVTEIIYQNCDIIMSETPTYRRYCDEVFIVNPLIGSIQLYGMKNEFEILKNNQLRFSYRAEFLYGEIVRGHRDVYRFQNDSLIKFLEEDNTLISQLQLIPLYIEMGNTNLAYTTISGLQMDSLQKAYISDYYTILMDLIQDDKLYPLELSQTQIADLQEIANIDTLYAHASSIALLHRAGLDDLSERFPKYYADSMTSFSEKREYSTPESFVTIYPNPTSDKFTLSVNNVKSGSEIKVTILSMWGKEVYSSVFNSLTIQLNSKNLNMSPGIYFINIQTDNKIETKKLVVRE